MFLKSSSSEIRRGAKLGSDIPVFLDDDVAEGNPYAQP
jgi:hypothetical protein